MTTPMRAPMTIAESERWLRLAAPDEPSMLPALVLPTGAAALRGPVVRVRAAHAVSRDSRLVFALVTLLLALAVAAVGAIRLLDRDTPLDTSCNPMIAGLGHLPPHRSPGRLGRPRGGAVCGGRVLRARARVRARPAGVRLDAPRRLPNSRRTLPAGGAER